MKRYVYPMVLFTDEEDLYTALYPDLNLLASGISIEETFARANDYLKFYLLSSLKFGIKVESTSSYVEIQALNPDKIVLLGSADIEEDSIVLTEKEQEEKNFLEGFVFTDDTEEG